MESTKWARGLDKRLLEEAFSLQPEKVEFNIDKDSFVVHCWLHLTEEEYSYGKAICSILDKFSEKVGKTKALGRAVAAAKRRSSNYFSRKTWEDFPKSWTRRQIERVMHASPNGQPKSAYITSGKVV